MIICSSCSFLFICNSSKVSKGIYEWYGLDKKDEIPRLISGKYLKLLYEIHEANDTLDAQDLNGDGKLDFLDLEIICTKVNPTKTKKDENVY